MYSDQNQVIWKNLADMSKEPQNHKNKMFTVTYTPRKGSFKKYGNLLMLQLELNKLAVKGSKSRYVNLIKDIILGIHNLAEDWIEYLITCYYLKTTRGKRFTSFRDVLLTKITFYEKISIAKEIDLIDNKDFDLLQKINTIRNAFVHGYSIRSKKFIYKGEKITLWGHIEVLVKDFEAFLRKISGQKVEFLPDDIIKGKDVVFYDIGNGK